MAGKCSHDDSRISCVDCNKPICSNCLVQCPVGFRCKACVGAANKTPLKSTTPVMVLKTLGASALVGCAGAWVITFINVPFVSCFIAFFLGLFSGGWLSSKIDYQLGHRTGTTVVFGVLIGMSLSPLIFVPWIIVMTLASVFSSGGLGIVEALTAIVSMLFTPVCFIAGVLRPTLWGHRF